MWPFHRKQKVSSKELANYIAINTVSTYLDKPILFKETTQLKPMDFLLEENIMIMVIVHFAVINYFNYIRDKYIYLLTNHIRCCHNRMLATNIIDSSLDFRAIFWKRFSEYRKALVADISEENSFHIGCTMCECFGVSDRNVVNLLQAMHLFANYLKIYEEYIYAVMK